MPSFYSARRNYVITTSLKVMYSTLTLEPSLRPLHDARAAVRVWLTPGIRRYLLVRHPYDRLVSFYADKFHTTPADQGRTTWQDSQVIFFPGLGLSERESHDAIAERLRAVGFARFVELLPEVYRRDRHLWPQSWSLHFRIGALPVAAPLHRILKMEEDLDLLRDELGLDLTRRANATVHGPHDGYFTAASYAIANRVYRRDFERFGYAVARGVN